MGIIKKPLIAALLLSVLATVAAAKEKKIPLSSVADLRYGATLFEYYQGNYFEALSELLVAEERGGIQGHGDNPKLIEGGISLSFGMENKAGELFSDLLLANENGEYTRPTEVRNAAWFYLGKLQYLRGDWAGTNDSLARISGRFTEDLLPELESMVINLAIRQNDLDGAVATLDRAGSIDNFLPYIYYNLGNAYSREQNFAEANKYYDLLTALPVNPTPSAEEEYLALYDKALTASGYSYILQGQQSEAIDRFSQVRLTSAFSDQALLGYGWAAVENEDYSLALKPWQSLSSRPLVYAATQEAYLAVPYAYEKLGAEGQALQAYIDAESAFEEEISRIDNVINDIDQISILTALKIKPSDNRDWFLLNGDNAARPELTYLTELFALDQFQSAVQELRDLLIVNQRLENWKTKLSAYSYLLDQRDSLRTDQLKNVRDRNIETSMTTMIARRDALQQRLDNIVAERNSFALVDEDEQYLLDLVLRTEKNLAILRRNGEDTSDYEEAYQRYRGLLLWQTDSNFTIRVWEIQREINALDKVIEVAEANRDSLQSVIVNAPNITPYQQRIAKLSDRLDAQGLLINNAVAQAEQSLRRQIIAELDTQKLRLRNYLSQTRLSVARLYDSQSQTVLP